MSDIDKIFEDIITLGTGIYRIDPRDALAAVMTEDERKRRKAGLDETRKLTRQFGDYLTGLEPSGHRGDDLD